jgi:hypothetical protein
MRSGLLFPTTGAFVFTEASPAAPEEEREKTLADSWATALNSMAVPLSSPPAEMIQLDAPFPLTPALSPGRGSHRRRFGLEGPFGDGDRGRRTGKSGAAAALWLRTP